MPALAATPAEEARAAGKGTKRPARPVKVASSPAEARAAIGAVPSAGPAGAARSEKGRPAGIERPSDPDDLKLISGVGPRIETLLNDLGIYRYSQVAAWKKHERDWVDGYLRFKGRIERDDWVRQAKALAKGGEAEYVRVFGKKPR
jgi:predicted flap endonuclease-1-like 5' DNA nuclease